MCFMSIIIDINTEIKMNNCLTLMVYDATWTIWRNARSKPYAPWICDKVGSEIYNMNYSCTMLHQIKTVIFLLPLRIQTPSEKVLTWIHRVHIHCLAIIQRSSQFFWEFLPCCLARTRCLGEPNSSFYSSHSMPFHLAPTHSTPTSLLISKRALRGTCKRHGDAGRARWGSENKRKHLYV